MRLCGQPIENRKGYIVAALRTKSRPSQFFMTTNNNWRLILFASEAYTLLLPIFIFGCAIIFGFHAILNTPIFGDWTQSRAVTNSFRILELLNCFCFFALLANTLIAFRNKNCERRLLRMFFLGFNVVVLILLYPLTIVVPML